MESGSKMTSQADTRQFCRSNFISMVYPGFMRSQTPKERIQGIRSPKDIEMSSTGRRGINRSNNKNRENKIIPIEEC